MHVWIDLKQAIVRSTTWYEAFEEGKQALYSVQVTAKSKPE